MKEDLKIISDELAIMIYQEYLKCDENEKKQFINDLTRIQIDCINEKF